MLRIILFLILVMALGFAFSWFADRPGDVTLVWQGTRYQTSLMVVISAFVALVSAIMTTWWIIATILRSPALMRRFYRNRQRDRGYSALSQGLIAASSGDVNLARRLARNSRKLLGDEALVQLLDTQTLQLEGDRAAVREHYSRMLASDETKILGLRGLHFEAVREGEKEAARHYAEEAAKLSNALPWAGSAVLKYQCAAGDWEAALRTLETNRAASLLPAEEATRKRAVLLTGQALAEEQAAPEKTIKLAIQALKLAPTLTPAAIAGASAYARTGDIKRAGRMLEDAWRKSAHRELAQAYVALRSGDTARERLERAKRLAALQAGHPESHFVVATNAIAAKDWPLARSSAEQLLEIAPSQSACLLMAQIEQGQNGDKGRMRHWLARAVRAGRDAAWVADGVYYDSWMPVSPVSGEIDVFEWKAPGQLLGPAIEEDESGLIAEPDAGIPEADAAETIEAAPVEATTGQPANPQAEAVADRHEMAPMIAPDDPGVDPDEGAQERKPFRLF